MNNRKEEYVILLDLLNNMISTIKVSAISDNRERERLTYAHLLANRFSQYASTVLYLLSGTRVCELPSFRECSFIDIASIDVLTRAAMETFLVFHYVFYAPTKMEEEKNYRYWCYRAAGIAERQNLPEATYEHKQTKAKDKKELDELRNKLDSNINFQSLKDSQKRQIFEGKGKWKWKPGIKKHVSWRDIAIDAGFSKMLASLMYGHLSGSAHSSSLSILQTAQALVNKETEKLIGASINTMNVLIANMIQEYCGLFSNAQDVLLDSGASNFVEVWVNIGRRLDENLDMG